MVILFWGNDQSGAERRWIRMLYGKDRTKPINHKKTIDPDLTCPKCGTSYQFLYLFGHDGNFQKFRCALCLRQFAPDKPLKPKKEPTLLCPVCGRGAHITHIFSDGIRVRCNAHHHPNPEMVKWNSTRIGRMLFLLAFRPVLPKIFTCPPSLFYLTQLPEIGILIAPLEMQNS